VKQSRGLWSRRSIAGKDLGVGDMQLEASSLCVERSGSGSQPDTGRGCLLGR
jgi:hypothetical protein